MKHTIGFFYLTLVALGLEVIPEVAIAQEAPSECQDVLAAPPFNDMLTRSGGKDFNLLDARKQGSPLLGLTCPIKVLEEYFEPAGWEMWATETYDRRGPSGHNPVYYSDEVIGFCIKQRKFWTFFVRRCVNGVSFLFWTEKFRLLEPEALSNSQGRQVLPLKNLVDHS